MKNGLVEIRNLKNCPPNAKVKMYYEDKEKRGGRVKRKKSKYTLDQIGDALFEFIKTTNNRFDTLEKNINTRLDYIVKANDLKDLPKNN